MGYSHSHAKNYHSMAYFCKVIVRIRRAHFLCLTVYISFKHISNFCELLQSTIFLWKNYPGKIVFAAKNVVVRICVIHRFMSLLINKNNCIVTRILQFSHKIQSFLNGTNVHLKMQCYFLIHSSWYTDVVTTLFDLAFCWAFRCAEFAYKCWFWFSKSLES